MSDRNAPVRARIIDIGGHVAATRNSSRISSRTGRWRGSLCQRRGRHGRHRVSRGDTRATPSSGRPPPPRTSPPSRPVTEAFTLDGLVMSHHKHHVAVFATSSRVGRHTTHNTVVHLSLRRGAHAAKQMRKGYAVHLVGSGRGSLSHLVVPRLHHAHVAPSP